MSSPRKFDWTHGHVQRETGTDSLHIERELVILSGLREWRIRFMAPAHIYWKLSEAEREEARLYVQDLFNKMLLLAKIGSVRDPERVCLEECLRTYVDRLYRSFVQLQWDAGNKKWLVPGSIQTRVLEEN